MFSERYEDLLDQFLEGDLSEHEFSELNQMLVDDPELSEDARDRLAEHRLLGLLHQPFDRVSFCDSVMSAVDVADASAAESVFNASMVSATSNQKAGPEEKAIASGGSGRLDWGRSHLQWFTFAALVLIGVGAAFWRDQSVVPLLTGGDSREPVIATLLLAENCSWSDGTFEEGERLRKGPLKLKSGLAVIRFDGGAEVVMQGDCSLGLVSAGSVGVEHGDIIVRASDEATGFRVQTPSTEMVDLGTEFSVKVGNRGETKLNVLEGEVSIRPRKLQMSDQVLLGQGKSVMVKDASSKPRTAKHDNLRFASVIKKSNPRSRADLRFAYEGFFYDEGPLPLKESIKGMGWAGPWRKRTVAEGYRKDQDSTNSLGIVHGQMNNTWGVRGGRLGMLEMPSGVTVRIREMNRVINMDKDGVYYISLMVRQPDLPERKWSDRPREGVRLTLRSNDDYYGECLSFGISNTGMPRVVTGQGVGFVSRSKSPMGQTTLWIGKIITRSQGEDEVYFRVFGEEEELSGDELNWAEPSQWDVVSRSLDLSAKLNLVVLTSEGSQSRFFDELRIGPTWRSVAPLRP